MLIEDTRDKRENLQCQYAAGFDVNGKSKNFLKTIAGGRWVAAGKH